MNQIAKIQDKIKCEIETAEKYKKVFEKNITLHLDDPHYKYNYGDYREFKGKVQFGKDLQQWIEDNIEEG